VSDEEYGDDLDKFLLVVDQLEVSKSLLIGQSPARARMALVLLDNLADVLLYRFINEREGMARRRLYWAAQRTYSRRDLRDSTTDFGWCRRGGASISGTVRGGRRSSMNPSRPF